jgi:DNA-binding NarL/FixJ family response regulator
MTIPTILIADDEVLLREGIHNYLSRRIECKVITLPWRA